MEHYQDGRRAIGETEIAHILDAGAYGGYILQAYRGIVAIGDDQRLVFGSLRGGIIDVDLEALAILLQRPFRTVGIGRRERGTNILEADSILEQCTGVELDAHRGQ